MNTITHITSRRGNVLVSLLVVLCLLGAGWYMLSPKLRDKTHSSVDGFLNWKDPVEIQENAIPYIEGRKQELRKIQVTLKSDLISTEQGTAKFQDEISQSEHRIRVGEGALRTLAAELRANQDNPNARISWQSQVFNLDTLRAQILQLDEEVSRERTAIARFQAGINKLERQRMDLSSQLARTRSLERELEIARVEATTLATNTSGARSVVDRLNEIEGNLRLLSDDVTVTREGMLSLAQVAADTPTEQQNQRLSDIMARY